MTDNPEKTRPTDLKEKLGCSLAYASQLLSGARKPSIPRCLEIFDLTGVKVGALKDASPEEIDTIRKIAA